MIEETNGAKNKGSRSGRSSMAGELTVSRHLSQARCGCDGLACDDHDFAGRKPALLSSHAPPEPPMISATKTLPAASRRPGPRALAAVIEALTARFGNRLVTSLAVRQQHAHTATWLENQPADAVVFAQSTEDVQAVVRQCAKHRVPVIAFGTGTSLEGHLNAPFGGIAIDLKDMNRVLAIHAGDLDCVVEPGVTRKQLNEYLRDQGLFFPIDPGADASLGGMAATRASGTNAVRYGTMKDNVLALTAVLANGEAITTGTRAKKSAAGYDLTRLLVGSEGTLGVITSLTLRLSGIPEAIASGVC